MLCSFGRVKLIPALSCVLFLASNSEAGPAFNAPQSYPSASNLRLPTTADFDGDGDLDVAVFMSNDSVAVQFNDGTANLSAPQKFFIGSGPRQIVAADFDGDGDQDIAGSVFNLDLLAVLLNNGSGSFSSPTYYFAGDGPAGVIAGDIDSDGDVDLIVSNNNSGSIIVERNSGSGTFMQTDTLLLPKANALGIGDIDNDGDLDFACNNFNDIYNQTTVVFANDGVGEFSVSDSWTVGTYYGLGGVAIAKVDNDSFPDIVYSVSHASSWELKIRYGFDGHLFGSAYSLVGMGGDFVPLDVDGDSLLDLLVTDNGNFASLVRSNGNRTYSTKQISVNIYPYGVATGDFNNDGFADGLVSTGSGVVVIKNDGLGSLLTPTGYSVGGGPAGIRPLDMNQDGRADLISVIGGSVDMVSLRMNLGGGTFGSTSSYGTGDEPSDVVGGDFDLDGDIDIAIVTRNANSVVIFKNNGNGTLNPPSVIPLGFVATRFLTTLDFDNDGDLDLAVTSQNGTVVILLRNTSGSFGIFGTLATGSQPLDICAADVNNDGFQDILVAIYAGGSINLFRGHGDGTFDPRVFWVVPGKPYFLDVADFNNDGYQDVAYSGENGYVGTLINDGTGSSFSLHTFATGTTNSDLVATDYDGDGDQDLLALATGQNLLAYFENSNGALNSEGNYRLCVGYRPFRIAASDFDGDGRTDIEVATSITSDVAMLYNQTTWPDDDIDGIYNINDNCPQVSNPDQTNADHDALGAVCDCNDTSAMIGLPSRWFQDADSDGFGNLGIVVVQCSPPSGFVFDSTDCNDGDHNLHPNTVWYRDSDFDGYGTLTDSIIQCTQPTGFVSNNADCNDADANLSPVTKWYIDPDGDNWGDSMIMLQQCDPPSGYGRFASDNCPSISNPSQSDVNGDGRGDACDNTPPGLQVGVFLGDEVSLLFDTVTRTGWTSVDTTATGPALPVGYAFAPFAHEVYYHIATNALFSGSVVVTLSYNDSIPVAVESKLVILHFVDGEWTDITMGRDTNANKIFGFTGSFSPFVVVRKLTCCEGISGNIDCDPTDGTDISDLSALIDYLYISFTPLCCADEANTDGQPGVDIADLSALIDYLYISFTPPAACQ